MKLETELNIILTELFRPIVAQCLQEAIQKIDFPQSASPDATPYGDFKWLCDICEGVPASTLRIKSAAGEIPGLIKFGKHCLYDKAKVLTWLRSMTRQAVDIAEVEKSVELQIGQQIAKRNARRAII